MKRFTMTLLVNLSQFVPRLKQGILSDEEAREFTEETSTFVARIDDLQRRLQLREGIDGEDV